MTNNRSLRVFLCHSSNDKPVVRELYQKLRAETWIQPWLDEEELYPGQDWNMEIEKAVEAADAIIVCLSKGSTTKEGYVQREIRIALDYADYKPEGTLYIMPVRLEECEPPRRLRTWQYADYFEGQHERAFQRLLVSLRKRADSLDLKIEEPAPKREKKSVVKKETKTKKTIVRKSKPAQSKTSIGDWSTRNNITLSNGMEFIHVPSGKFLMGNDNYEDAEKPQHTVDVPYDYWMSHFPVTNEQYNVYVKNKGFNHPVTDWIEKETHPVGRISWNVAMNYCKWLNNLLKNELPLDLVLRLPTEAEWEKAARGEKGNQWPWGNEFDKNKCNTAEGGKEITTPVGWYSPHGDSVYGCADMVGNVWEWTHSRYMFYPYQVDDEREDENIEDSRVLRGGGFKDTNWSARCAFRADSDKGRFYDSFGLRMAIASPLPK